MQRNYERLKLIGFGALLVAAVVLCAGASESAMKKVLGSTISVPSGSQIAVSVKDETGSSSAIQNARFINPGSYDVYVNFDVDAVDATVGGRNQTLVRAGTEVYMNAFTFTRFEATADGGTVSDFRWESTATY